jgi:hypothetical protein
MGPPSYMLSFVNRNVVMRRTPVSSSVIASNLRNNQPRHLQEAKFWTETALSDQAV